MDEKEMAKEIGQGETIPFSYNALHAFQYDPLAHDIMKSYIAHEYTAKQCIGFAIEGCDLCRKGMREIDNIDVKDLNPFLVTIKLALPQKLKAYEDVIEKLRSLKERARIQLKSGLTEASFIHLISLLNEVSVKRMPDSFWGEMFESDSFCCTTRSLYVTRNREQNDTREFLNVAKPYFQINEKKMKD